MKFENIDIDETISHEQYVEFLYESFIKITKDRFPNDRIKQQVRKYKTRIVGSCPVCGDSMKSSHKHRGNIILTGKFTNYYKCFNCGIFKRIDYFLKDYHIDIDLSIKNSIKWNSVIFPYITYKCEKVIFVDFKEASEPIQL